MASIWLYGQEREALAQVWSEHQLEWVLPTTPPKACPDLVVLSAPVAAEQPLAQVTASQLQQHWQQHGLSQITLAQMAIQRLLKRKTAGIHRGTVVFVGSSLMAQPQQLLTASLQAGLRQVAQSLAREFAAQGIHVVYVAAPPHADVRAVASLVWQLHQQPPSVWTQEVHVLTQ